MVSSCQTTSIKSMNVKMGTIDTFLRDQTCIVVKQIYIYAKFLGRVLRQTNAAIMRESPMNTGIVIVQRLSLFFRNSCFLSRFSLLVSLTFPFNCFILSCYVLWKIIGNAVELSLSGESHIPYTFSELSKCLIIIIFVTVQQTFQKVLGT